MSDYLVSLIRTAVPTAVGGVLAWLATVGLPIPEDAASSVIVGLTGAIIAVYYGLVRFAEQRWPWVGALLGRRETPSYGQPPAQTETQTHYGPTGDVERIDSTTTWTVGPIRSDRDRFDSPS